jgi:hypothetical protein
VGSVLGGVAGLRPTLVAAGVCTVLQAVPMIGQQLPAPCPTKLFLWKGHAAGTCPAGACCHC